MRSDYALYTVSAIFFIITALVFVVNLADFERNLSAVSTVILGLLFIALGYSQRPKLRTAISAVPVPATVETQTVAPSTEVAKKEPVVVEQAKTEAPKFELTQVKGIKEKRAEQLKALGINTAEDLANASAKELAAKLKIAPYFTEQWIENAKKLVGKS